MFVPRHVATRGGSTAASARSDAAGRAGRRGLLPLAARAARGARSAAQRARRARARVRREAVGPLPHGALRDGVDLARRRGRRARRRAPLRCSSREDAADFRPELSMLALDLETDGWDGPLLSAADRDARTAERVFVRGAADATGTRSPSCGRGGAPARAVRGDCARSIPDVVCGWNVVDFDLAVLEARCRAHRVPFALGRAGEAARVLAGCDRRSRCRLRACPGSVVLDGIATPQVGDVLLRPLHPRARRRASSSGAARRSRHGRRPGRDPPHARRGHLTRSRRTTSRTAASCSTSSTKADLARLRDGARAPDGAGDGSAGRLGRRVRSPVPAAPASSRLRRARTSASKPRARREPRRTRARLGAGPLPRRPVVRLPQPVPEHHPHLPHRPARPLPAGRRPRPRLRRRYVRPRRRDPARDHRAAARGAIAGDGREERGALARHQDPR